VGCYFGGMLSRAGIPVVLVGRPALVEAVHRDGLFLDCMTFQEYVSVEAATEISAARGAEIVLFCVKTLDTEMAARQLAPHLDPASIVVSLQNGVDNIERMQAAGIDAIAAAVWVAAAVPEPGHVKHSGRGDLVIGPRSPRAERVASLFSRAAVSCQITDNIAGELWKKLIGNCVSNAISALGRVNYNQIVASEHARPVLEAVVREALAVAHVAGVEIPALEDPQVALAGAVQMLQQMGPATSSTAQDLARGKRTEIDSLNGYIVRCGSQLGVPTPVNQTLYGLVKLAELGAQAR